MVYFIITALPLVVIGTTVAICIATISKRNKSKKIINDLDIQASSEDNKEKKEEDYMTYGMSMGMCLGVAVGSALSGVLGSVAISYGICFGMIIGMTIGMSIKRKK